MKTYELQQLYVIMETDEQSGEKKTIASGFNGEAYNKFFTVTDENDVMTVCIPRKGKDILVINDVIGFDERYEDSGFILYEKEDAAGNDLNFAYFFEEDLVLELGQSTEGVFFVNNEEGKKLAAYIKDYYELIWFPFVSYVKNDDTIVFETKPEEFRIFDDCSTFPAEQTKEIVSYDDVKADDRIFFWRDGKVYKKILRTKSEIQFDNAYLLKNESSDRYELYGFKEGKPFLLGTGKTFKYIYGGVILGGVILDDLLWQENFDNDWLLEYEPIKDFEFESK